MLSKSRIIAALAWQGYLLKGRGLVKIEPYKTPSNQVIIFAKYCGAEELEQNNHHLKKLLSSYCQLTEFIACYPKNTLGEIEIGRLEGAMPPTEHKAVMLTGLFQPGDGITISFDSSLDRM